jgi:hypothetical protein
VEGFDASARAAFRAHAWPGNIRELAHLVERAVLLGRRSRLQAANLNVAGVRASGRIPSISAPREIAVAVDEGSLDLKTALDDLERRLINRALTRASGNRTEAAALLGLNRTTFLRKRVGYDFPVLGRMQHKRARRAIATMIRDNLCETIVDRDEKLGAGLIYADTVGSRALAAELRALGAAELSASSPISVLARAASPSPSEVDAAVVETARTIGAPGIVEVVTFLALMQLLHRLGRYYSA